MTQVTFDISTSLDGFGTTFTFVREGIETAIDLARQVAGDKDVAVAGGASAIQQALAAGLVDEFTIHVAPVLLGGGIRLFADAERPPGVELVRTLGSARAAHLTYHVAR